MLIVSTNGATNINDVHESATAAGLFEVDHETGTHLVQFPGWRHATEEEAAAWHAEHGDAEGAEKPADLSKLKVAELVAHAAANRIDLGGATKKADVLAALAAGVLLSEPDASIDDDGEKSDGSEDDENLSDDAPDGDPAGDE